MPRKFPSEPAFVLHCESSITDVKVFHFAGENVIAVGTVQGVVSFFDFEDFHLKEIVFEHPSKSVVQSMLQLGARLLIHVRARELVLLERLGDKWTRVGSHPMNFPGFCGTVAIDNRILLPVTKGSANIVQLADVGECGIDDDNRVDIPLASENVTPSCSLAEPDGRVYYVGDDMGVVMVLSKEGLVNQIRLCNSPIFAMAASSRYLAAGSSAQSPIFLLDRHDLAKEAEQIGFQQKAGGVSSLCFSSSGSTLFGGFWDGTVRAFAVKSRRIVLVLPFHSESVTAVRWLDTKRLAAASKEGKMSIWEVE